MRRSRFIFASIVVVSFVGYQPMLNAWQRFRDVRTKDGVLSCEYEGRTYRENEQRKAEDACNVCACGRNGWECTRISCPAGSPDFGTISGKLSSPKGGSIAQRVCAINLKDDKEYCRQTIVGDDSYAIYAPAGSYWVYAAAADEPGTRRAYYSEFMVCGRSASCKDHTPITVDLQKEAIAQADPQDWDVSGQIDLLNIAPSKWEYNTHNYYPNSAFFVKGRGFSKVEIFSTPYPPNDSDPAAPVGEAALESTERDIQTWSLAVPEGFQATWLYAVGTTADGEYMKSRRLRIIRPVEGPATAE